MDYLTLLGDGKQLLGVDIGYLKALNYGGVIFLFLQVFIILLTPVCFRIRHKFFILTVFVLLIFIYNVKIYAFCSSVFMPLYFLMLFCTENLSNYSRTAK
jgi:hypothetical protein